MTGKARQYLGVVALVAYVGFIFGANWAIQRFGVVPVGFGLVAPAGVYFAGGVFVARDIVQLTLGKRIVLAAILVGAGFSALISARLAVASGVAFFVSETADYAVYTPLAERGRIVLAVLLSDTVGLALDSALFLYLAFGNEVLWLGLSVGKEWPTLYALPLVWLLRRRYFGRGLRPLPSPTAL